MLLYSDSLCNYMGEGWRLAGVVNKLHSNSHMTVHHLLGTQGPLISTLYYPHVTLLQPHVTPFTSARQGGDRLSI